MLAASKFLTKTDTQKGLEIARLFVLWVHLLRTEPKVAGKSLQLCEPAFNYIKSNALRPTEKHIPTLKQRPSLLSCQHRLLSQQQLQQKLCKYTLGTIKWLTWQDVAFFPPDNDWLTVPWNAYRCVSNRKINIQHFICLHRSGNSHESAWRGWLCALLNNVLSQRRRGIYSVCM